MLSFFPFTEQYEQTRCVALKISKYQKEIEKASLKTDCVATLLHVESADDT